MTPEFAINGVLVTIVGVVVGLLLGSAMTAVASYHRGFERGYLRAYLDWCQQRLPPPDDPAHRRGSARRLSVVVECGCAECHEADRELAATPARSGIGAAVRRWFSELGW